MTDWNQYYQTRFQVDPRRAVVWTELARWIQKEIDPGACVLELGAGYCHFINQIRARRKIAVDVSDTVRRSAGAGVEAHVGSCADLSFVSAGAVDAVFASNLYEHLDLPDVRGSFREVLRVLRPGGKFLILQPNFRHAHKNYFDDYTHVSVWTDVSLTECLRSDGFRIDRVIPKFLPFSLDSNFPVHPLLIRLYLWSPWRPRAGQMFVVARKPES